MAKVGTGFQSALDDVGATLKAGGVPVVEGGTIDNKATLTLELPTGVELVEYTNSLSTSKVSYENALGYPVDEFFPSLNSFNKSSVTIAAQSWDTVAIFLEFVVASIEVKTSSDYDFVTKLDEYGATLTVNGLPVIEGTTLVAGDVLTLTMGDGYELVKDGDGRSTSTLILENAIGAEVVKPFTPDEDLKVGTLTIDEVVGDFAWFNIQADQVTALQVASNNVYLIDYDKLKQINIERYSDISTPDGIDRYDYGVNILSVLDVPFTIPPELILNSSEIVLGAKQLTVTGRELETDLLVFDLGEIRYISTEGNVLDYANKVFSLFLPYSQPIVVAPEYVVNEVLRIEYRLDLYTGEADILIHSSAVDSVVYMQKVNIGVNIPYASQNQANISVYNDSVVVGGFNDVYKPYLELMENKAHLPYGFFTCVVPDEGVLSGFSGYVEVEKVELKGVKNLVDSTRISDLLMGGVIIK